MNKGGFFNFDPRQPVNQWMGIALLALMCFWVILYYAVHKAEAYGQIIIVNFSLVSIKQ